MDQSERDRIEAKLPKDREFRMPAGMTNEMRSAAWDAYAQIARGRGGTDLIAMNWADVCVIFCAAFDARSSDG